jgi:hypothetical protein
MFDLVDDWMLLGWFWNLAILQPDVYIEPVAKLGMAGKGGCFLFFHL